MTICLGVGLFGFIFLGTSVLPIPECLFPSLGLGSFQPQFFSVCFWLLFLFLLLLQSPICIDWQALHYSIGLLYCFFKKFGFLSAVLNGWFPLFYLPLRYPIGAVSKADKWRHKSAYLRFQSRCRMWAACWCFPQTCRGGTKSSESVQEKRLLRRPPSLPSMLINKGASLLWWAYLHFIYVFSRPLSCPFIWDITFCFFMMINFL